MSSETLFINFRVVNMKKIPLPPVIRIEPSALCNFHCVHCTTGLRMNPSGGIMSKETFDIIFNKIKNYHFRAAVLYHGGEPLLNKHLFYFIDKMKTISNFIKTVSNGSLLDDDTIKKIVSSPLDVIEFSLDGLSPKENNSLRRGSDFIKISNQIYKLCDKIKKSKSKLKVYISNIQIPTQSTDIKKITVPYYLKAAFSGQPDTIAIRSYYSIYWPGYPKMYTHESVPENNYCDHVINTITVRWNGDIVACCYDLINMMVLGNLIKEDLFDIWNNNSYQKLRKAIAGKIPPKMCKDCNVLYKEKYLLKNELNKIINLKNEKSNYY